MEKVVVVVVVKVKVKVVVVVEEVVEESTDAA